MNMCNDFIDLKKNCLKCKKCELYKNRTNVVFGVGDFNSKIMFIGEGPGKNEDLKGEPFVGRAGVLLDKMLKGIGLIRNKNIFITNIVKCRPPGNRDPLPNEQKSCENWLYNQIDLINPKIIVCLGRIAAIKIFNPNIKITKEHGNFTELNGILYMATLHPAALLRNPFQKPEAFKDFLILKDKINELNIKI